MNNNTVQTQNGKGEWVTAYPYPFYVRTLFGRWLPVCTKHKLIFRNITHYDNHMRTTGCDGNGEILMSDHKRHLKGYKKAKAGEATE